MKTILLLTLLSWSVLSQAQVNLDRAYLGKTGNTLFYDLNDANSIWAIPKYLEATPLNEVVKVGSEYRVRYNVSLPETTLLDLAPIAESPLVFRAFRATEFTLEQLTDVDPRLKPNIIPLGDMGMFGEQIPYSISLQAKHYPNLAKHTTEHLFDGKRMMLLGRIFYSFSAARSGQLFQAQSVVAILAPKKAIVTPPQKPKSRVPAFGGSIDDEIAETLSKVAESLKAFKQSSNNPEELSPMLIPTPTGSYIPQILFHSQSECWDKGIENVICLKDQ